MTHFETITREIFDLGAERRLSVDDERAAIRAAKRGDEAATIALLYAYAPTLRALVAGARRAADSATLDRDEAISVAVVAVLDAVRDFDETRGERLAVFVADRIRMEFAAHFAAIAAVAVPEGTLRRYFGILRRAGGDVDKAAKLAPRYEMTLETFFAVRRAVQASSIDAPVGGDEAEERAWIESARPLWVDGDEFEDATNRILCDLAFAAVDDLEEDICRMRYGFTSYEPMSDAEIGGVVGMPKRTVQRRRTAALDKMRDAVGL